MRMNMEIVLYSYNRLLLTNKKEQWTKINNMDESYRYYDKHKRVHTIYMIPSTWRSRGDKSM